MKLSPSELAKRISAGGRAGGRKSAATQRLRRERYLRGELTGDELARYEAIIEQRRQAASKGGTASAKVRQQLEDEHGTTG